MSKREKLEQAIKVALKQQGKKQYKITEICSLDKSHHTPNTYDECDMEKWESITYFFQGRVNEKQQNGEMSQVLHFKASFKIAYKNENWEVEVQEINRL